MLGIILAPYGQIPGAYPSEVGYSYGGDGTFLCPPDQFYNTRGEVGFYHDTQLGAPPRKLGFFEKMRARRILKKLGLGHSIPTDFDLAPTYGWVPHIDGWVAAKEGFQPGTWVPPNGWNPAGSYGPQMVTPGLGGYLGDAADIQVPTPTITATPDAQAAAQAAAQQIDMTLQAHQDRMFKLTIISTTIVGLSALLATLRTWKQLKRDEELFKHARG